MMETICTRDAGWEEALGRILERAQDLPEAVDARVREIIAAVRGQGDAALMAYTREFDHFDPAAEGLVINAEQIAQAPARVSAHLLEALQVAAQRIEDFHRHELETSWITTTDEGMILGQKVSPIERVGVYVPGGRNAFPSTVLMNVIPARLAGVQDIVVVTPTPGGEVKDALLAAAHIAGVERLYRIGGAQAIAALAYGTESVPKVDKVVGPGNIYVAHAKRILQGTIGIDAFAGPSEILVIADARARPGMVAADLLSQAEHDPRASAMLLTPSVELAQAVRVQLEQELQRLDRREVIAAALAQHGVCVITRDVDEALSIANRVAPEHLELMVDNAWDYLGLIRNAGAIFLGHHSPEALGDYIAGPNHTLPTGSTARFSSPLGVHDFVKRSSIIACSQAAISRLGPLAARIARAEELEAHARSVESRLK